MDEVAPDGIDLNGEWQLNFRPQATWQVALEQADFTPMPTVPAQIPGNVELDLMRAGVLPDLAVGNNVYLLRELECYEWWYRRRFTMPVIPEGYRAGLVSTGWTAWQTFG